MTAIRKLIEAVDVGGLSKVNERLADMYSDLGDEWPWDWMSMVNSAYKGSLDAAKALHEALLPGWVFDFTNDGGFVMDSSGDSNQYSSYGDAQVSRHWLLAILRAYEAKQ